MNTTILKPGLLVSLHTTITGGVQYNRVDIEKENIDSNGQAVERWETTKIVADVAAHERAVKIRGKASALIRGVCARSSFGLLCPIAKEKELDQAVVEARAIADAFNNEDLGIRIGVYVLKGRIAETDDEAARAVGSELRELLDTIKNAIGAGDVQVIREAAAKAKQIGRMLDETTEKKVQAAVVEVRKVAREIVKQVVKGEEVAVAAAKAVTEIKITALDQARFAFLDLDAPKTIESLPVPPRGLDLEGSPPRPGEGGPGHLE